MLQLTIAPLYFLPIAGSNLQKLECAAEAKYHRLDVSASAKHTTLTELSLRNIHCVTEFHKLRSLAVQKLFLIDCPGAEVELFVPGALAALETLHICEEKSHLIALDECLSQDSAPEFEEQQIARQILVAGKVLLSLPRLVEVGGRCKLLFLLGIINEQIGWKRTSKISRCKSLACSCQPCRCASQKWEKVQ